MDDRTRHTESDDTDDARTTAVDAFLLAAACLFVFLLVVLIFLPFTAHAGHFLPGQKKVEAGICANRTNAAMDGWGRRIEDAGTGDFEDLHRGLSKIRGNRCRYIGHTRLLGHKWVGTGRMVYGVTAGTGRAWNDGLHVLAPCFRGQPERHVIGVNRNVTVTIHVVVSKRVSPTWRC